MRRVALVMLLSLFLLLVALVSRSTASYAQGDTPRTIWRCVYVTCQTLRAVTLISGTEGWAVGTLGTILRLQGASWTVVPSPTTLDLFGVSFTGPDNGWAVGGYGGERVALRWNGAEWTTTPFAPTGELPPGSPNAPRAISQWGDEVWMVGERGVAFHYLDGRWVWQGRVVNKDLNAMEMVGPQEAWAVGGKREELSTASEAAHLVGDEWKAVTMPTAFGQQVHFTGLDFVSASEGWAVGEYYDPESGDFRGAIARYTTAEGWRIEAVDATPLTGITMLSNRFGWAVGWRRGVYGPVATYLRYVDGVWLPAPGATSLEPLAVDAVGGAGWAVGYAGVIIRLEGNNWETAGVQVSNNLRAAAFGDSGWAVGAGGVILNYVNGAWRQAARPSSLNLNDVAVMGSRGWAVGSAGTILRLDQGVWQAVDSPLAVTLNSVALSDVETGWAVGGGGAMLRLEAGAWSVVTPTVSVALYDVALSGDTGWAVGERQTNNQSALLRWQDGRWSRVASPTGQSLRGVTLTGDSGWAVGDNGVILRLQDGEWRLSPGPANEPGFAETLFAVHATGPDRAWAVGANGAALEYRAGVWLRLPLVSKDTLYGVAPGLHGELTAVGAYGTILRGVPVTPRAHLPLLAHGQ